ncbi:MAG: hypothetical protein HY314_13770 [Acidobacteria bacterium]|nr:hypothetical protein [Acidobacteriota bacterium]
MKILFRTASLAVFLLTALCPAVTRQGETSALTQIAPAARILFAPRFIPLGDNNQTPVLLDGSSSTGGNLTFSWESEEGTFVNGTTPAGVHPQVTFPGEAAYKITLHVTNQQGMITTAAGVVPSAMGPPTASFIFSPATIPPMDGNQTVVRFSSEPSVGDGLSFRWEISSATFVNGTSSTSPSPEVTFPGFQDYDVALTVTDRQGRQATTRSVIELDRGEPVASYDYSPAMIPPMDGNRTVVTFVTNSALGSGLSFDWEILGATFVNGTGPTSPNPQVTFPGAQDYPVRLTVTDEQGRQVSARGVIPLDPVPPTARFSFSPPSVPRGDSFQTVVSFDPSASTGIRLNFSWAISSARFENGTSRTSALPQVTFPGRAPYSARLTVTDAAGRQAVGTGVVPVR